MWIIKHRKIFYSISLILLVASISAVSIWGLNPGIDFKGGSILEVSYSKGAPAIEEVKGALSGLELGEVSVRQTGGELLGGALGAGYIIRMRELNTSEHDKVIASLGLIDGTSFALSEKRFDSIGPLLGKEAVSKSVWAIIFVLLCIIIFIAIAFRKVSEPVSSWKYGVIAVAALMHDVIIPTGIFSAINHFKGFEIDTLFVTAILVVLGFSVHDTIVVFDRTRENLKLNRERRERRQFEEIVGESVGQTFVRSINTSLTTLLSLVVLYLIGPESTKYFSAVLLIGITVGTYSSIFIASPLLVTFEKWQNRKSS